MGRNIVDVAEFEICDKINMIDRSKIVVVKILGGLERHVESNGATFLTIVIDTINITAADIGGLR